MSLDQVVVYLLVGGFAFIGLAAVLSFVGFVYDEWDKERKVRQLEVQEALSYYRASQRLDTIHGDSRVAIIQRVIKP